MIRTYLQFRYLLALLLASLTLPAWSGPLVAAGGKSVTPSQYLVTIQRLELRRTDGTIFTIYSGSGVIDLGNDSVPPGGTGGSLGQGVTIPPGTYNAFRITFSPTFTVDGAVTDIGVYHAACSTGGSGTVNLGGYTLPEVIRNGLATPRAISIPPEAGADLSAAGYTVTSGGSIQLSASIPDLTVTAQDTVPPAFGLQYFIANTLEFYDTGAICVAMVLPPVIKITTNTGSVTISPPAYLQP